MGTVLKEVLGFAMKFALGKLKDVTPDKLDTAIDLVTPIFIEMFGTALATGQMKLSAGFRKPYELKALRVLRSAGLVEEF